MNVHVLHLRLTQNNAWNIIDIPSIYIYIYIYISLRTSMTLVIQFENVTRLVYCQNIHKRGLTFRAKIVCQKEM